MLIGGCASRSHSEVFDFIVTVYLRFFASLVSSIFGLPTELLFDPASWNPTTHGNITVVIILFVLRYAVHLRNHLTRSPLFRAAWFLGIGRDRYYYGQKVVEKDA
jgi:hypothetical protein